MKRCVIFLTSTWLFLNLLGLQALGSTKDVGINDYQIGLGNLSSFVGQVQVDAEGNTESFDLHPYLNLGLRYDFNSWLSAFPELILTLPETGRDSQVSRFQYFFMTSLGVPWRNLWFRLGTGFAFYNVSMDGGTQRLQNGDSFTDFPNAQRSSTARNMLLTAGLDFHFPDNIAENLSARAEAFVYNIEESEARTYSYIFSFHYHFGSVDWENIIQ